ncbi:MAG: hypothetical protein PHO30_06495 [Candidatus Omnitrophica bacterium]|jgi:hypothetical protein|nr:hypothetical protein [Candidatus Omnitrophota bacterium]
MKRKLDVLFAVLIVIFILFVVLANNDVSFVYRDAFVILAGTGMVITLFILNRLTMFRKKFQLALRHILENNFQTGISMPGKDEMSFLAGRFNAVIDRINSFDRLREDRVDTVNKLLTTLNRTMRDGVMIFDLSSGRIKINKAAQDIFAINQDDLSIDSVVRLESNGQFNALYQDIMSRRSNTIAADVELFLPILRAKAAINLKMFAIKDKDEHLNSVLCVFNKA